MSEHATMDRQQLQALGMLDTDTLTIEEVYRQLRQEIEVLDNDGHEYFSISCDIAYNREASNRRQEPIGRYRWIACYAVTGGSEGHYVHVDRIYLAKEFDRTFTTEQLFLAKTFGGWARACEIAEHLGRRLGA